MAATPLLPQLTVRAILLGGALSVVLAGANAYLGLFAGLTVSASIPAAVLSMAVLRLLGRSNILENNIVQTTASAGEALAAGVIFTIPALVILGHWEVFDNLWVAAIAGLGGLLGVLFIIPLRHSLIVEERLAYPEGTATAEVLKAGDSGGSGVRPLAWAAGLGALWKFAETGLRLWPGSVQAAGLSGNGIITYVGASLSPALLAVGYIVGLNIALLVFAGGVISWYIALPIYSTFFLDADSALAAWTEAEAIDLAHAVWGAKIRYLGVGAMLTGGIWALLSMRRPVLSAIRGGLDRALGRARHCATATEQDLPMQFVLGGILLLVLPLFLLYLITVASPGVALTMTVVMVVAGFLFSSVAAYMAGLVGSSNNPVSGVTIATILFSALLLTVLLERGAPAGPVAAIIIGAVICCAAAIAGDSLQDLKAGHIVGATPWRQQLVQGVGVLCAMLVMAPILNLLLNAYGIGAPTQQHPNPLPAPQATLMASVAQGVFGGGLPWSMVAIGAAIGVLIILIDEVLKRYNGWRAPVLAVAVGLYLPLRLAVPIAIGGILAYHAARLHGSGNGRAGMLFAAGLITGEALIGILLAVPIVISGSRDVLALPFSLGSPGAMAAFLVVAAALYLTGAWRVRKAPGGGSGQD